MTIRIGGRELPTTRPSDLDAQLIAITGCSAAENAAMLGNGSTPFQVARALHPLIADGEISVADLTSMVEAADIVKVRQQAQLLLMEPAIDPAPHVDGGA